MAVEQPPEEVQPPHEEDPGTEIVPRRFVACPHLGLSHDRTVTAIVPTEAHICYARRRRYSPSVDHQSIFCFSPVYPQCPYYPEDTLTDVASMYALVERQERSRSINWLAWAGAAAGLIVVALIGYLFMTGAVQVQIPGLQTPGRVSVSTPAAGAQAVNADGSGDTEMAASGEGPPSQEAPAPDQVGSGAEAIAVALQPKPEVSEQLSLTPKQQDVGWWVSADSRQTYIGDSFLYAGAVEEEEFISAIRFDLRRIARGAPILGAAVRLTGARDILADRAEVTGNDQSGNVTWLAQLIAENDLEELPGTDFRTISNAPASITLSPQLKLSDVAPGTVNEWALDENARNWLYQQIVDGATSVTVRIAPFGDGGKAVFAWDSGHGSESQGEAPVLVLDLGPPPPTPPPTPTRPVLIATLTPEPENVLTVVARSAPATARSLEAETETQTQTPVFIITPTPLPENLATVQAAAIAEGLPPVVLHTPAPANAATVEANSQYATAVALTTGTFTPVPTGYVTPAIYYPPPPPENVATAAARALRATAQAESGEPTATLPWNAVAAVYVFATSTPENQETAIAHIQQRNLDAATTGTPTPTSFNLVVITSVPEPTATPIPLVVSAADITSTPTPTPTRQITRQDIEGFRNKILFLSDRTGTEEVWAMDPDTGEVISLVTDGRLHEQARELFLSKSPDGRMRVFVQEDDSRELQIKVEELEYDLVRQITHFREATSYDPAWSPVDDRIAFVSTDSGGDEIYVVSAEGGDPTRLTFNAWEWDKHPSWSPDGGRIAFFSNRDTGQRQIWIMNADGSNQRNLSKNEYNDWDPIWVR